MGRCLPSERSAIAWSGNRICTGCGTAVGVGEWLQVRQHKISQAWALWGLWNKKKSPRRAPKGCCAGDAGFESSGDGHLGIQGTFGVETGVEVDVALLDFAGVAGSPELLITV